MAASLPAFDCPFFQQAKSPKEISGLSFLSGLCSPLLIFLSDFILLSLRENHFKFLLIFC